MERKLTSEQIWIGGRSHPCFLKGSGFKDIIWWARKECDEAFLCAVTGAGGVYRADETTGKLDFTCFPSFAQRSRWLLGKGSITHCRTRGTGFIAESLGLFLLGLIENCLFPSNPFLIFTFNMTEVLDLNSRSDKDLFLVGAAGRSQTGRLWGLLFCRTCSSFSGSVQKKRIRLASSFSNEATDNPCMLATPSETKLRYETSGASCLKT